VKATRSAVSWRPTSIGAMSVPAKINIVTLGVADIGRAAAFYWPNPFSIGSFPRGICFASDGAPVRIFRA